MASKISYIKFIKEDMKQRGWVIAIWAVGLFLFQPIFLLIKTNEKKRLLLDPTMGYTIKDFKKWLIGFMGYDNNTLLICVIVFALLCGVTSFYYLDSKERLELLHSLPIRREKLFFIHYTSGFLIFLIPFTVVLLCCLLNVSFQGLMSPKLLQLSICSFGMHILFFLLLYTITIFSMIITGKFLVGLTISSILFIYGSGILALFRKLGSMFLSTYFLDYASFPNHIFFVQTSGADGFSSPVLAYVAAMNQMSAKKPPVFLLLVTAAVTIILLIIDVLLYKKRPTESAGNSIAFLKAKPVLKILFSVPLGIAVTFYLSSLSISDITGILFLLLSALCTFLFALIIEFIYTLDIRRLLQKKCALAFSVLLTLGILSVYQFDLFHFDSYLPKKNDIRNMSFYMEEFNITSSFPVLNERNTTKKFLNQVSFDNFEPLYQLAQNAVDNSDPKKQDYSGSTISLKFTLKNGRNIYRQYLVEPSDLYTCLKYVLDDVDYKKALFGYDYYEHANFSSLEITDVYRNTIRPSLSKEQIAELMNIYQEELLNVSYQDVVKETSVGSLRFLSSSPVNDCIRPLYKSFSNTFSYLENAGYSLPKELSPEEVEYIEITNYETEKTYTLQSTEEIQEVLPYLTATPFIYNNLPLGVTITFKRQNGISSDHFYFKTYQLPERIKSML